MSMHDIALCGELFSKLYLMIVEQSWVGNHNERDRYAQCVEDGARTYTSQVTIKSIAEFSEEQSIPA